MRVELFKRNFVIKDVFKLPIKPLRLIAIRIHYIEE